jgi:hypothetical protein
MRSECLVGCVRFNVLREEITGCHTEKRNYKYFLSVPSINGYFPVHIVHNRTVDEPTHHSQPLETPTHVRNMHVSLDSEPALYPLPHRAEFPPFDSTFAPLEYFTSEIHCLHSELSSSLSCAVSDGDHASCYPALDGNMDRNYEEVKFPPYLTSTW